ALRVAGGAATVARPLLPGRLRLARALVLVGRLVRRVPVLGLGVRGRAVALVHVAVVAVTQNAHRCVHVRLDAGSRGRLGAGVLVDLVLRLLGLPTRLTLRRVGRPAVAARRAFLLGRLGLVRALALVGRPGRDVRVA